MNGSFLLLLARRLLFGRAGSLRSSVLATAAVGILFASTFVLVSLGILAGFQESYRRAVLDFNAHILVQSDYSEAGLNEEDAALAQAVLSGLDAEFPHVRTAFLFHETLMPTVKGLRPVLIKGIDLAVREKIYPFEVQIRSQARDIQTLIGADIADLQPTALSAGKLRVLALADPGGKTFVRYEDYPVAGTFRSGLYNFDARYVLTDRADLAKREHLGSHIDGFEVRLNNADQITAMALQLKELLPPMYRITTWDELNGDLLEALRLEKTTLFAVALLILAIACLNIFGFNFLFFLHREREFQILSLLGLPRSDLLKLMALLSLIVGAIATTFGALLAFGVLFFLIHGAGIPLDASVYFVGKVPAELQGGLFLSFILCTWLLCLGTSFVASRTVLKRHLNAGTLSF